MPYARRTTVAVPVPKNNDAETRRRWRCLLLGIKAKLECVSSKIETFDEAFLAHVVTETGQTLYERLQGSDGAKLLPPVAGR